MSTLKASELVNHIVSLITTKANQVAVEEIQKYQNEHENALIESEVRDIVMRNANSELMLRMCNFKPAPEGMPAEGAESELVDQRFEQWFAREEETLLRQACVRNIAEELKKRSNPAEEKLSFSEKFARAVKAQNNTVEMLKFLE